MGRVAIITDSTACLPRELADKYGIDVTPVEIIFEDRSYRDGVDITPAEVYSLLPKLKRLPSSSSPPPGAYLDMFKKKAEDGDSILCIAVSSKFSTLFDTARTAAEMAREVMPRLAIEVLDCRTAAGGEGLVALAAARAAASGKDLSEVVEVAQNTMSKVHMIAVIDTLHYLVKSGRVPQAAAWAAALFKIKPVVQVLPLSGEATLAARVRTRPRAIERLLAIVQGRAGADPIHAIVMHTDALEEAENLRERISSDFNCLEIYVKDFSPVMGVQTGPGVLGVAFYADGEMG